MIIDVHQHYLSRIPEYPGESRQAWLYHQSRIQGYRDVPALIADMDAAGIDQIVWQGEYLLHAENCVERNRVVAAALALYPTRLRAFASIQPTHPDAVEHIKHARDMGLLGVGELNPGAQGFTMRDATVLRVLSYCADEGIPVLFHVNEPVGPAYMGKVSTPLIAFYECAARFPELKTPDIQKYLTTRTESFYRITAAGEVQGVRREVWCTVRYDGAQRGLTVLRWREQD